MLSVLRSAGDRLLTPFAYRFPGVAFYCRSCARSSSERYKPDIELSPTCRLSAWRSLYFSDLPLICDESFFYVEVVCREIKSQQYAFREIYFRIFETNFILTFLRESSRFDRLFFTEFWLQIRKTNWLQVIMHMRFLICRLPRSVVIVVPETSVILP